VSSPYSEKALELGNNPTHWGPPERYNCSGKITGPCGDTMEFWLNFKGLLLVAVGFTTDGCISSKACGSMACEIVRNKSIQEIVKLKPHSILKGLGRFPEESEHCALLAANTLKEACRNYMKTQALYRT
jgi:nitrogen fixation NifU-like protein